MLPRSCVYIPGAHTSTQDVGFLATLHSLRCTWRRPCFTSPEELQLPHSPYLLLDTHCEPTQAGVFGWSFLEGSTRIPIRAEQAQLTQPRQEEAHLA